MNTIKIYKAELNNVPASRVQEELALGDVEVSGFSATHITLKGAANALLDFQRMVTTWTNRTNN